MSSAKKLRWHPHGDWLSRQTGTGAPHSRRSRAPSPFAALRSSNPRAGAPHLSPPPGGDPHPHGDWQCLRTGTGAAHSRRSRAPSPVRMAARRRTAFEPEASLQARKKTAGMRRFLCGVPTGIRTPVTVTRFLGQRLVLRFNEFCNLRHQKMSASLSPGLSHRHGLAPQKTQLPLLDRLLHGW